MELLDFEIDDLAFYESMLCDPEMMADLGGPLPQGQSEKVQEIVHSVRDGSCWYLKIMPADAPGPPAGSICVWEHEWNGESINEIGWMVLPAFQGRGLANGSGACRPRPSSIRRRWDVVWAFPATTNGASNAICRKTGFSLIGESDFVWSGRPLRCNHWRVDVRQV